MFNTESASRAIRGVCQRGRDALMQTGRAKGLLFFFLLSCALALTPLSCLRETKENALLANLELKPSLVVMNLRCNDRVLAEAEIYENLYHAIAYAVVGGK